MSTDFLAALSFSVITIFTPGPNNITSAAMGALHGYRQSFNYLLGIASGFLLVMFLSGVASATVLHILPGIEPFLRWAGAVYVLYLAYGILKAGYTFESENTKPLGFVSGFLLQLFNPKGIIYGLTLFSSFLAPITANLGLLLIASILLTLTAFCSISVWTLFGSLIKKYLRNNRARMILNVILALFLLYTALDLVGVV